MKARSIVEVVAALNAAKVRYLIAGGLAVIAHGYVRATKDVDVILDLEQGNALSAARSFSAIGLVPAVPVRLEELADPERRRQWQTEKGAVVPAAFVALDDLLAMKRRAGRPQDLADIAALEELRDHAE